MVCPTLRSAMNTISVPVWERFLQATPQIAFVEIVLNDPNTIESCFAQIGKSTTQVVEAQVPVASPITMTNTSAGLESPAAIENVSRITFATEGADFDPAVSQDGSTLVFASTQHRTKSDIYLKQVSSRVVTRLTNDPGDDVQPAISPDGTRIAFASNRNGNWDIFVMPAKGGQAVQWTDEAADDLHPSW